MKPEIEETTKMVQLTPLLLNQQIVSMRQVIHRASVRLVRHLIRQVKKLKQKQSEFSSRKIARIEEEIKACKEINRDNVSKFALLNNKSLQELNIRGSTPPDQRIVFKMSVDKLVVSRVEEFRKSFPDWRVEVPFLLQRLGLQYQKRPKNKLGKRQTTSESGDKDVQLEGEKTKTYPKRKKTKRAVDKLLKDEIKAALEKDSESVKELKQSLKIRTIKPVELPSQLSKNLLPSQRIVRGEAIIESLDLTKIKENNLDDLHLMEIQDMPTGLNPSKVLVQEDVSIGHGMGEVNDAVGFVSSSDASQQTYQAKNFDSGTMHKLERFSKRKRCSKLDSSDLLLSRNAKYSEKHSTSVDSKAGTIAEKSDIHPSWAARIREREHMKALNKAKPKRIVFDDN